MRILVVEDEILILKSLELLIARRGIDVHTSTSGNEALKLIEEYQYDRILCDLMLKDITGFDVLEECRKIMGKEELARKFVIMTAYSSERVLLKAERYQCPVLRKPFHNIQEVIDLLTQEGSGGEVHV